MSIYIRRFLQTAAACCCSVVLEHTSCLVISEEFCRRVFKPHVIIIDTTHITKQCGQGGTKRNGTEACMCVCVSKISNTRLATSYNILVNSSSQVNPLKYSQKI